jgi:predicted alpha/beta hydrolase family esterase
MIFIVRSTVNHTRGEGVQLLTVPGIDGSGPDHWQSRWEQLPERRCHRFAPSSWAEPEARDWVAAIERGVAESGPDTVVVAHSLGCLAAAQVAATGAGIRGVVLVSPPDIGGPAFPRAARGFEELEPVPLRVPGLVIASSDDPYCSPAAGVALASAWEVRRLEVGAVGHINEASGLGAWVPGWQLVQAFLAGLAGKDADARPA